MKILFIQLLLSFLIPSNAIIGTWNTFKDNTIIEIYEEDGSYFGKIISSDNDKALKGTLILRKFKFQNKKWIGKLYSIKMDKLVDAEIQLKENKLEVTAFMHLMNKSFEWEKY